MSSTHGARPDRFVRVAVLVLANAACVFVLWHLFGRAAPPAEARDAAPSAPSAFASDPAQAADAAPARRDTRLEARLRARIGEFTRKASESTHGKVAAGAVHVAVHVRELSGSSDLVDIEGDRPMRPASNMKVVTTAAALVSLGPSWAFETLFESSAAVEAGVLRGDLVVHAGGDPLYSREAHGDVRSFLEPVADALAAHGIRRIDGAIVLDEGTFDAPAPGPGWPASNQHWQEFCALAGGFSANAGCLTALVSAREPARAALVELRPLGHGLAERLSVSTAAARSTLDVRVSAQSGVARVEGSIPRDVPSYEARFAAPDPVALFGGALEHVLEAHGIGVRGGVRRERVAPAPDARALHRLRTPLLDVLEPINTWSNNACADQLFLSLGRAATGQGTRAGGSAATVAALRRLGVPTAGFTQVDGSGLSRDDRVSARQISALLDAVMRLDAASARAFHASLAVGGESGTLDRRLGALEGRVRAKTGFIGGTSALSGFVETDDGRVLAFSILVEYPTFEGLNTSCWKPMQDAICAELAGASG